MPFDAAAWEEVVEMQVREMQTENGLIIDDNTHLQRKLIAAKDEIRRLSHLTNKLQAEKEAQTRELIDRGIKLEAELQQLRSEIKKLNAFRLELTTQLQGLTKEVNHLQAENQQLKSVRAEVEGMNKELIDARRAFEYEKKFFEQQAEQKKVMERNLISMASEIEKLRAQQMNAGRRIRRYRGGKGPYSNHGHPRR